MCGIAGLISNDAVGGNSNDKRIRAMLESIARRGRDDEGVWHSSESYSSAQSSLPHVSLGHRRLSIIDTSNAGHQPMLSDDGRFVLTFNGEIYNYRELRRELEARRHTFRTDCDTEVLLRAFEEWGTDCLPRLNGMFAFAVWDEQERTLTLARDRIGIKPLYYADLSSQQINKSANDGRQGAAFLFASEVKALLATGLVKRALDLEGLNQFLTFLWTPDPHTLFQDVKKLPPAHLLVWRDGNVQIKEWWDVRFDETETGRSEEWWQEQVSETLDRVVGMEMVADVPLGAFLSGGIDSSLLVALMKQRAGGRKISTYTIGIEAEDLRYDIIPDDARWARQVAKHFDTEYHETMLAPDVAALLPKLVYLMDQPANDMSIASYLVSRAARETLTVLLSGMGGDEVFAGYPRHLAMKFAGALDFTPQRARRSLMNFLARTLPGGLPGKLTAPLRNAKKFARSAALDFEDRYLGFGTYFTVEAEQRLYVDDLKDATREYDPYYQHRRYFARVTNAAPLDRVLYVDLKTYLPCHNLATTDKTSMAATLEVRVPYLNHELVELTARMPADLKLRGMTRKYILKRAAEKLLPKEIVWRKKAGFGAPVRSWLRGALQPLVNELLSEENVKRRNLFEYAEVRRLIEANSAGREDYSLQIFQLLTLELWQQAFMDAK